MEKSNINNGGKMLFKLKKEKDLETKEGLKDLLKVPSEGEIPGGEEITVPSNMHPKRSDVEVKLDNIEKKIDRVDAYTSTLDSKISGIKMKVAEHEENIQRMLSIYEVVSEKFNPFVEKEIIVKDGRPGFLEEKIQEPGLDEVSEEIAEDKISDISDIESMYRFMAQTSVSLLITIIEDLKRMGIDTSNVEEYLPEEVKE
jgi:archaellum component FlaC